MCDSANCKAIFAVQAATSLEHQAAPRLKTVEAAHVIALEGAPRRKARRRCWSASIGDRQARM